VAVAEVLIVLHQFVACNRTSNGHFIPRMTE
jgi:hypothetical protein